MKAYAAALAAVLIFSAPLQADEISDTIQEALAAYHKGDLAHTKQTLDYASQLIASKNAENLKTLLPAPLAGWSAEDGEAQAAGMAMFGGGLQASRVYTKGDQTVEMSFIGDSPLLAQFIPMLSNPALAGAMGKPLRVGTQMALEDKNGEIKMVVANRFLVTISGTGSRDDKLAYAKAIDLEALAKL